MTFAMVDPVPAPTAAPPGYGVAAPASQPPYDNGRSIKGRRYSAVREMSPSLLISASGSGLGGPSDGPTSSWSFASAVSAASRSGFGGAGSAGFPGYGGSLEMAAPGSGAGRSVGSPAVSRSRLNGSPRGFATGVGFAAGVGVGVAPAVFNLRVR